jgi:hypothetical protein
MSTLLDIFMAVLFGNCAPEPDYICCREPGPIIIVD